MRRREFLGAAAAGATLAGGTAASEPPTAVVTLNVADLDRAVQSVLESKRLGQPVFVRLTRQDSGKVVEQLAQLSDLATRWLGQKLTRLHAVGNADGPASVTLLYAAGASAIITVTRGEAPGSLDLMLLGNRGSMQHEASVAFSALSDAPDAKLLDAIRQALAKGTPIAMEAS